MNSGVLRETVISRPLSVLQFRNPLDCRGNQLWNGRAGRHALLVPLICSVQRWLERKFRPALFSTHPPRLRPHTDAQLTAKHNRSAALDTFGQQLSEGCLPTPSYFTRKSELHGNKRKRSKDSLSKLLSSLIVVSCRENKIKKYFLSFHPFSALFSQSIATRSPWYLN